MNNTPDTQQRIIDAGSELIHSRSCADIGVAAICEQAGVQKGSCYHFFPSKQHLTLAVLAVLAYMEGVTMLAKTHNDPTILRDLRPALAKIRIPRP